MKIENSLNTVRFPLGEAQIRSGKAEKEPEAQSPEGDSVHLSARLQAMQEGLASGEVVKADRVEEIKKTISEGRFEVNPYKVADRLLETVRELILARSA